MAYRLAAVDYIKFAMAPLVGYTPGAVTFAALVKRAATGQDPIIYTATSGGTDLTYMEVSSGNQLRLIRGGSSATGTTTFTDTTKWYLLAATAPAGNAVYPRLHIHDGTGWIHENANFAAPNGPAWGATDQLDISSPFGAGFSFAGDIVCAGIKKADRTDVQVETLSRTQFQAWRDFAFDWLIGFDSSLETAGILQDQASPGTGDEVAISGTTVVADPPGWAWVSTTTPIADFTATPLTGTVPSRRSHSPTPVDEHAHQLALGLRGRHHVDRAEPDAQLHRLGGVYTIKLTATNTAGSNTKTRTAYITVNEAIALVAGGGIDIY
jgi:hypothetical protein